MYLVKNCHKENNLTKCGTLKIGTLQEYRETFEQQVLDSFEGTFATNMNLKDVHLPTTFFDFLFNSHHSHLTIPRCNLSFGKMSAILPDHVVLEKFDSTINFNNHNRFIYCLSKLEKPNEGFGIFKEYDSLWYFELENVLSYAEIIRYCLLKHVEKLLTSGIEVFTKKNKISKLKLHFKIQDIIYIERNATIDNRLLYTDAQYVVDLFENIKFTKPSSFEREKEVRIIFDFFDGDEILYPSIKHLIIDASPLIPFVKVG